MDELDLSEIENRWDKAFPLIQMGCFSKGCSVGYGFVVNDEFESKYAPASQEFIDNAPMDISALVLEVKRLRQDRAGVRRDALLEGAKAVCTFCAKSDKPWKWGGELQGFMWYHENPNGELIEPGDTARRAAYCKATNIHQLLAADQGQSQGEQE